ETLPKRGYRFIAPVSRAVTTAVPEAAATSAPVRTEVGNGFTPATAPVAVPQAAARYRIRRSVAAIVAILVARIALGAWYFFNRRSESAWSQIRIVPLNGLPREGDAAFSPDGNQVAFDWAGEKGGDAHIYISQIGATDSPRQLNSTAVGAFEFAPVWSP